MNPSQEQQLFRDLAEAMRGMPERILARQLVDFYKAHPDYGCGAADEEATQATNRVFTA